MAFRLNIDNILETNIRELNSRGITSFEYEDLYSDINNEKLKTLFTWLHGGYMSLYGGYTVFGQVFEGMEVVDKIAKVEKNISSTGELSVPKEKIIVEKIVISEY